MFSSVRHQTRRRIATRFQRTFVEGGFSRNVAVLFGGTAIGQLATLMFYPILTRIFLPEAFGILSVFGGVMYLIGTIGALRYELAIPIARSEEEAVSLVALCGLSLVGATCLVTLFAVLAPASWMAALGIGALAGYRLLIPVGFACIGAYSILAVYASRVGAFSAIARTRLKQGFIAPLAQIALGLAGAGTPGMIIGFIIGQSSGVVLLGRVLFRQRQEISGLSFRQIFAAAGRYRRFPLYSSWSAIIESAGSGGILYMLVSAYYVPVIAGYSFLTGRVLGRPLVLVAGSLTQVYTGEAGRLVRTDPARLRRRFLQVSSRQLALALVAVAGINLTAFWAYPLVFGSEWAAAVAYVAPLSLALASQTVLLSVSPTLHVLQKQGLAASWQPVPVILLCAVFWGCAHNGLPAITAFWGYGLIQLLTTVVMFTMMLVSLHNAEREFNAEQAFNPAISRRDGTRGTIVSTS
jgi:O-antigen/teichoic acid export membrane protein